MISTGFVGKYAKTAGLHLGKYVHFGLNPKKCLELFGPKNFGKTLGASLGVLGLGSVGLHLLSNNSRKDEPYKEYPSYNSKESNPDLSKYYYYNYGKQPEFL